MSFEILDINMIALTQGEVLMWTDVLMIKLYFEGVTNKHWSQF
jgi:hypothetical protein